MMLKRDRHAAIRRLVAARPIGSQGELVGELSALGFDVTQATVSRDIAELGPGQGHARRPLGLRRPRGLGRAARPPSDERLRRILADIPVTVGPERPDPRPHRAARHRQRHRAGDRGVDPRPSIVGTVAGDNTLIVLFPDEPALERLARHGSTSLQAPAEPATIPTEALVPMKKVVLAYSGGLDTSVAVAWLKEQYGAEVVTLTVDLGGGSDPRGRRAPRDVRRRVEGVRRGREGDVRQPATSGARSRPTPSTRAPTRWPPPSPGRCSPSSSSRSPRRRAPTPSPTAARARATTRSGSTSPSTRSIRGWRSSRRCASAWA